MLGLFIYVVFSGADLAATHAIGLAATAAYKHKGRSSIET